MTVGDLIEILSKLDPVAEVILARDPEGRELATMDPENVSDEQFYSTGKQEIVEFDDEELWEEDGIVECVILYPNY